VRFALRDAPLLRTRRERVDEGWRDRLADSVVAYLKLANWIFRRRPPAAGGSHLIVGPDKDSNANSRLLKRRLNVSTCAPWQPPRQGASSFTATPTEGTKQ
jgi:hypothetical protein